MKLLLTPNELNKEFDRLMKDYSKYYWSVAWAGARKNFRFFDKLLENKKKIKQILVGIHFYQTAPEFIETFMSINNVRFMKQPGGTFHPKVYLFFNNDDSWEAIIGSSNFTLPAFSGNTEASMLVSSQDENSETNIKSLLNSIGVNWRKGTLYDADQLKIYIEKRKIFNPNTEQHSAFNNLDKESIYNMPWDKFASRVISEKNGVHSLEKRLSIINDAKILFSSFRRFKDIDKENRKYIAGIPNDSDLPGAEEWGYFGSMKGAGHYKNRIIEDVHHISKALDEIPLMGEVTKSNYQRFVMHFRNAFDNDFQYVAPASRLLAMKRPDSFVCLDSKNRQRLCKAFKVKQTKMTYDRYWNDIIENIRNCIWYQSSSPKNNQELKIAESKAAFLDSLYYNP